MPWFFQCVAFLIVNILRGEGKGPQVGTNDFQFITLFKLIVQRAYGNAVFVTGFHFGNDLPLPEITGVFGVLAGLAIIETSGIMTVDT